MPEPLPDRTAETVAWLRETIAGAPADAAPELHKAVLRILDLYKAAAAQARRDDSSLHAWALNFDLEGFTPPNESGARTLLPGLTAVIHQLALAYGDDEPPRHLVGLPTPE
ncbi:hypothetical protein ACF1AE_21215 [Streptomyces sp. NPDC014986]|uniref:hypothetical protein n=1 Tax=Streptomyces sp. NPDC014986 TaxID=3364934 RepID=UPI003702F9CD